MKVLRFSKSKTKKVLTPLADHFKLDINQCPSSEKDKR